VGTFNNVGLTDPFDALLISTAAILEKVTYTPGGGDAYGQPSQSFTTKLSSWPCRVSTKKGGIEYKEGKEFAKNTFRIFMRPPLKDDGNNAFTLGTHHWIQVTDERGAAQLFNVLGVNDPSFLGHHLEVEVEQVLP
jgi:head-tail adaptor